MVRNGSSEEVLKLAQGFMESRILLSGARLNLFTLLAPGPLSAREVAVKTGTDLRATTILLDALSAMGFLVKEGKTYRCAEAFSPFLTEGSSQTILPMLLHADHLWDRWSGLTDRVRSAPGARESAGFSWNQEELRAFIGAMDVIAAPRVDGIVAAVHPGSIKTLLDVGGGSGSYTIGFLKAVPGMKATLFDTPQVIEMAREHLSRAGMLPRVTLVPGDFYRDEFPHGHDLSFVSAIIHQNGPEQNMDLFNKVFRSLQRGGRIVIRDHVMEPDKIRPRSGAIFAVNMLVGTPGGNTYTYEEIKTDLIQAGFTDVRLLRKGDQMDGLVEAIKP